MNPKLKLTPEGFCVFIEDSHLSRWIEESKRLDASVYLPFLDQYLPVGGTAIDIGASLGDHTVVYANRVGPKGRVIAFEANPEAALACQINMKPYPWVSIYGNALGEAQGWATLVRDINVGASYLVDAKEEGDIFYRAIDSLDRHEDFGHVDFIKIDAEGWEPRILTGAQNLIERSRPVLLIEVNRPVLARQNTTPEALLQQLEDMGYKTHPEAGEQYDMLAIPKERA